MYGKPSTGILCLTLYSFAVFNVVKKMWAGFLLEKATDFAILFLKAWAKQDSGQDLEAYFEFCHRLLTATKKGFIVQLLNQM